MQDEESSPLVTKASPASSPASGTSAAKPSLGMQHMWKLLFRKHSSGDLHSRLKTRKLLGVGETDDGDVHRSKLSQILGHSEQLFVKLPKGLRSWQLFLAIFHTFSALWALILPHHFLTYLLSAKAEESATVSIRCYGAVLIAFSVMSWCAFRSGEKDVIRSSLLASALYFIIQTFVTTCGWFQHGGAFVVHMVLVLLLHSILIAVSSWYFFVTGCKILRRMRKSPSTSDLKSEQ